MLTTVALLIIVLGLMVSLARYVRRRSAEDLTRRLLVNLNSAMLEYTRRNEPPAIESFIEGRVVDYPRTDRLPGALRREVEAALAGENTPTEVPEPAKPAAHTRERR